MNKTQYRILLSLTLFIGLSFSNCLVAQNYMLINKDRKMTFARLSEIGVDSVFYFMNVNNTEIVGADTIHYFSNQLQPGVTPDCELIYNDTVILGTKVLVQSDSDITHVFFNQFNDSIFIKSQIKDGDTWKVYNWSNGSYVKATVVNHLLRTILPGVDDSLYRIQFNVFTLDGIMLTDTFPNATKIDITENYGISEFFDFNIFPLPGDSIGRVLRGLENPDAGIVNIDAQNAFNYGLGYEFHYKEESVPDNNSTADKRISAWKYFVLAKSEIVGGVTYTMERIQFDTLYFDGVPTSTLVWDTAEVTYNYADYAYLDSLEFQLQQQNNFGYSDWVKIDSLFAGIPHKYIYDWFNYNDVDLCLSNPDAISQPEQLFGDGLGLMHYTDSTSIDDYYSINMTYFKVGLNEWGTPYDFSALDNTAITINNENILKIYPNPCNDVLHINLQDLNQVVTILNTTGTIVMQTTYSGGQINVSSLEQGMYFVKISGPNNFAVTQIVKL